MGWEDRVARELALGSNPRPNRRHCLLHGNVRAPRCLCAWRDLRVAQSREDPWCDTEAGEEEAIEGWWRRLRQRLDETAPADCENRPSFLRRLRRTVLWMNVKCRVEGRKLCRNQKVRANRVLVLKGAKSEW